MATKKLKKVLYEIISLMEYMNDTSICDDWLAGELEKLSGEVDCIDKDVQQTEESALDGSSKGS